MTNLIICARPADDFGWVGMNVLFAGRARCYVEAIKRAPARHAFGPDPDPEDEVWQVVWLLLRVGSDMSEFFWAPESECKPYILDPERTSFGGMPDNTFRTPYESATEGP